MGRADAPLDLRIIRKAFNNMSEENKQLYMFYNAILVQKEIEHWQRLPIFFDMFIPRCPKKTKIPLFKSIDDYISFKKRVKKSIDDLVSRK